MFVGYKHYKKVYDFNDNMQTLTMNMQLNSNKSDCTTFHLRRYSESFMHKNNKSLGLTMLNLIIKIYHIKVFSTHCKITCEILKCK